MSSDPFEEPHEVFRTGEWYYVTLFINEGLRPGVPKRVGRAQEAGVRVNREGVPVVLSLRDYFLKTED